MTPQSTTGKTPFKLTYGVDTMIPIEVEEPSPRVIFRVISSQALWEKADLTGEAREMTHIRKKALKQRIANRDNFAVVPQRFEEGDWVLRHTNIGLPPPGQGKLAANWEGLYKVIEVLGKGAYKLSTLFGFEVLRSWNTSNLRKFYV